MKIKILIGVVGIILGIILGVVVGYLTLEGRFNNNQDALQSRLQKDYDDSMDYIVNNVHYDRTDYVQSAEMDQAISTENILKKYVFHKKDLKKELGVDNN